LLAPLVLLAALGWFYARDESPPDDEGMRPHIAAVPLAENGLLQLLKSHDQSLDFDDFVEKHGDQSDLIDAQSGTFHHDALADDFLAQAGSALTPLDAILALPHFEYTPKAGDPMGVVQIGWLLEAAETLRLRATRREQTGDLTGATADVLRLRRLAARSSEAHLNLILWFCFRTVDAMADAQCVHLLNDPRLRSDEVSVLAAAWSKELPWAEMFRRSLSREYQGLSICLGQLKSGDLQFPREITLLPRGGLSDDAYYITGLAGDWIRFTLKPNATRRLALDYFRSWDEAMDIPFRAAVFPDFDRKFFSRKVEIATYVYPNFGGRYFLAVMLPRANVANQIYFQLADDRLAQIGLALRRYHDDNRTLPSNLETLVPKYLPEVPMDPFNGQPLRYTAAKGSVSSVGTGSPIHDDDPFTDEAAPTLTLTFPKAIAP
jgi:hypothetical protein